jgi:hypothetical protein
MRAVPRWLLALALGFAAGLPLGACLDLTWREGIACDDRGRCPAPMRCCEGECRSRCEPPRNGGGEPGSDAAAAPLACPDQEGGCYACTPGCVCACGGYRGICCLKFGVATCFGCP